MMIIADQLRLVQGRWQLRGTSEEGAGWLHEEPGEADDAGDVQDAGHWERPDETERRE